jgi:hypothetical protein
MRDLVYYVRGALIATIVILVLVWTGNAEAGTLSDYATSLAGQPVTVHCVPMTGLVADDLGYTLQTSNDDGSTTFDPDVYLSPVLCYSITRAVRGERTNAQTLGTAIEVLTHEATHIRLNSGDESTVSCNAILRIDRTIRLLGLTRQLHALHEWAWASYWASPDDYLRDPVCRAHPHNGLVAIGPVKKPGKHSDAAVTLHP